MVQLGIHSSHMEKLNEENGNGIIVNGSTNLYVSV